MKKVLMPILLCILVGFLLSKFMLSQYDNKQQIKPVFSQSEKLQFLQYGVYSTKESMLSNVEKLNYYIYTEDNDLFYVFVGITKDVKNIEKIKGYFKKQGYDIYIKEYSANNEKFLEVINYYDQLIEKTNDDDVIRATSKQVLEKYEELVINGKD